MIVYFSASGHTQGAAERLHELLGGSLARLEAAESYSPADLDWTVEDCRANREQRDQAPLPDLATRLDLHQEHVIYLGFPIWWGIPPKLVDVFLKNHDLSEIRVLPFCTSGSSPVSQAEDYLARNYPQINWQPGLRFNRSLTESQIRTWAS